METINLSLVLNRPVINDYQDPVDYLKAMIEFRKKSERSFSVMKAATELRKVSSALVSLVLQRKRKITLDRADEFAKLMGLTSAEKIFFRNWLETQSHPAAQNQIESESRKRNKKEFAISLLNDWLNVYVKDCFMLDIVQKNPHLVFKELGAIASKKRIEKSLKFLLREGYLRKTIDGRIVVETVLATQEAPAPSQKIRAFHKAALSIAKQNIDLFASHERHANTLVLELTPARYHELTEMICEFSKLLQDFAAADCERGDRLYQMLINLSPTGGRVE